MYLADGAIDDSFVNFLAKKVLKIMLKKQQIKIDSNQNLKLYDRHFFFFFLVVVKIITKKMHHVIMCMAFYLWYANVINWILLKSTLYQKRFANLASFWIYNYMLFGPNSTVLLFVRLWRLFFCFFSVGFRLQLLSKIKTVHNLISISKF